MLWWIWLIVALVAAVIEIVGSGLVFAGIAGAALIAIAATALSSSIVIGAIVFAGGSVAYLLGLRPPVLRLISGQRQGGDRDSAGTRLMGRRAIVTQPVSDDGGQIRIGQGEFWSARLYQGSGSLPAGAKVEVVWVEGLTALVTPVESSPSLPAGQSSSLG